MIKIIKSDDFEKDYIIRKTNTSASITTSVAMIITDIVKRGDEALREYTEKFDGCLLESFELPKSVVEKALGIVDREFIGVMERAAENIEDFHRNQLQTGFDIPEKNGKKLGQIVIPIERVGIYVPGGSAPYPSTVLMNVIPAKIAGVKEIIIATPPSPENGVDARVIAAAKIAGANRIFTVGGAQAIAALAYGTQSIPRVDKITGPGNAYVAEAKRQVYGIVGIDMIAGPSDILVIADLTANPEHVAADMLSQCEHGPDSPAILITNNNELADKVSVELETQLSKLPREEMARKAIEDHGLIIISDSIDEAFELSNIIAPEHLEIVLDEPFCYLDKVKNAGSVFMGKYTPEPIADYYAGPNHTLPTSGTSRFSGPLSVEDFTKKTSYTYYTKEALEAASDDVIRFAEAEGFRAHALTISKRLD